MRNISNGALPFLSLGQSRSHPNDHLFSLADAPIEGMDRASPLANAPIDGLEGVSPLAGTHAVPAVSSFALQYGNADASFATLQNSSIDLFITDGNPFGTVASRPFSDSHVAALEAQGRLVVGYVNVSVTDDARYYWNASWTTNGHDTGTPDGDAPSWLQGALPIDFNGDHVQDALIVKYWDPAWQNIVIAQAVELVTRGYSGVFLDDVGRYFEAGTATGNIPVAADQMIDFITRIRDAIIQVNSNAVIVTNTDPYIVTNNSGGANPNSTQAQAYLSAVDYHLIENQTDTVLGYARTHLPGDPLLILESTTPPSVTFDQAWGYGPLYTAPNTNYNSLGSSAYPQTAGADTINGGVGPNQILGLAGNDILSGNAGNDHLDGGADNDLLIGGLGADVLIGGSGTDMVSYEDNQGAVFVNLTLGLGYGNAAAGDTYSGIESARGSMFDDTIIGDGGANRLEGGDGNDILRGAIGADALVGGNGLDTASYEDNQGAVFVNLLTGQGFNNAAQGDSFDSIENLAGSIFADYFIGTNAANTLSGGDGNDTLLGALGADALIGGNGSDTASYEDNQGAVFVNLTLGQGFGNAAEGDTFSSIENLIGTVFYDTFIGDGNANRLDGARGNDTLTGAGGADVFVFDTAFAFNNIDSITDFAHGTDHIELAHSIFTVLPVGALAAGAFTTGIATTAAQHILYDSETGALSYDADGSGAGAAIQFATLQPHLTLGSTDFLVA
jgi:uncharacterized protein (TIGR01370 family)